MCNNRYEGVVWNEWGHSKPGVAGPTPPIAIGETFAVSGCGSRTYAISVVVSGECLACAWGCHFVLFFVLCAAGYAGVGIGLKKRQGAQGEWAELLPHQPQWRALRSLVDDGVAFARGQRRGFSRVGSAAAAAPESAPSDEEDGGSGRRSRRSKEPKPVRGKGSSGKSSGKSSKKSKRSSKADKDSGGPEPTGGGAEGGHEEETAEERKQRILQEERSAGVHSSQQAIKVVGLSAT